MSEKKERIPAILGIATAIISGCFATVNLAMKETSPLVSVFFFTVTVAASAVVLILVMFKKPFSEHSRFASQAVSLQREIDFMNHIQIKRLQFTVLEHTSITLSHALCFRFIEALGDWQGVSLSYSYRAEPVLYFRDIITDICRKSREIIRRTISQNNLETLSERELRRYIREKTRLFLAVAEDILRSRYSEDICILPFREMATRCGRESARLVHTHLSRAFIRVREISITCHRELEKKAALRDKLLRR